MELDFTFEKAPWEAELMQIPQGGALSALRFLALMEGENEEAVQEALLALEIREITLDISELPKAYGAGEAAVRLRREAQLVKEGRLLQDLEENDPLRLYLEEVAGLPAAGDPQRMADRFAGGYDPVLPGLTNLMLPLVIEMSQEMTGRGVLLLDLIQEGSLGLWQGILSFRSGDFMAHSRWWIGQYLAKAVTLQARQSGLLQRMKQAVEDYRAVDEKLLMDLGRNPTMEEMAQALHMPVEEEQIVANAMESARMLQRAKQENEPVEEENPEDTQHVEDTALFQARQRIADLLSGLDEREAQLLTMRFGLEGGLPLSPEDTGKRLGMTAEEVVAMEAAALAKLRNN